METREQYFVGHKAKFSGHRTRQKENLTWFLYKEPQQSLSKQKLALRDPQDYLFKGASMDNRFIGFMPVSSPMKSISVMTVHRRRQGKGKKQTKK